MISALKFRWQLSKLFSEQDRVRKIFTALLTKARKEKAHTEEIEQLNSEAWMEESMVTDDIDLLVTRFWMRRAKRLFVPTPERSENDMWRECSNIPRWVLTERGISAVRAAVREEERVGREVWTFIISGFIGTIGALTGLLAVFLSR